MLTCFFIFYFIYIYIVHWKYTQEQPKQPIKRKINPTSPQKPKTLKLEPSRSIPLLPHVSLPFPMPSGRTLHHCIWWSLSIYLYVDLCYYLNAFNFVLEIYMNDIFIYKLDPDILFYWLTDVEKHVCFDSRSMVFQFFLHIKCQLVNL